MSDALSPSAAASYGLIQGLTEFLPVSSSGHLALAHRLGLGAVPEQLELPFDVLLHGASLLAIILAFRGEILAALRQKPRFFMLGALAVIPAGLAGLFAKHLIDGFGDHLWAIGLGWLWTAGLLWTAQRRAEAHPAADLPDPQTALAQVDLRAALWAGLLQVGALLPGVSRSGSTLAGGLIAGLAPQLALAWAFLIGLPLIAAATAKDALDGGFRALSTEVGLGPLSIAFVVALVTSLLAIGLLRTVMRKLRLRPFAYYCAALGLGALCWDLLCH